MQKLGSKNYFEGMNYLVSGVWQIFSSIELQSDLTSDGDP